MAELTAEKFAQRVFEVGLLDNQQLESAWGELGTREVSVDELIKVMVRKELLTNFQVDRLKRGERTGYIYGKYKPLYLIGTGSFARVYRAVHVETGRVVALKVLRKRYRDDAVEYEQFLREGRMGARLRHVNVVPIYEVDGDPRAPYLVMEFVEGQTLRELLRRRQRLDPLTSLKILADVTTGLAYAVEEGITHRDLKMSNVLVTAKGTAKLVDFGLAAVRVDKDDEAAECPNARAIDYAALERATGMRKDDTRSDLYFAGCLLYHMLTGRPPLTETKDRIQRLNITRFKEITPATKIVPGLPHSVILILNKAMEMDPEKRYRSAREIQADIKRAIQRLERGQDEDAPEESAADRGRAATQSEVPKKARRVDNEAPDVPADATWTLLIVESHVEMQNLLRERLKRRGYRVLIISDPSRALARFHDAPPPADCVIFCTTELGSRAVEAFNHFGENEATREIPAILMLDEEQKSLARTAHPGEHRVVLAAPKLRQLRATLLKLLSAEDRGKGQAVGTKDMTND